MVSHEHMLGMRLLLGLNLSFSFQFLSSEKSTKIITKIAFGSPVGDEIFKLELVDFLKLVINFVNFSKKTKNCYEKIQFSWS